MSSVKRPLRVNGEHATIGVENPATGDLISTVPVFAPEDIALAAARARAAQPAWAAMGFARRGEIFRRAQRWMFDNSARVLETVVAETGKTYEDAQLTDLGYTAVALGFWARNAPSAMCRSVSSASSVHGTTRSSTASATASRR
jgi:acyl-CoA reductase-like NAD-dependent aldehyde dehydrogenase